MTQRNDTRGSTLCIGLLIGSLAAVVTALVSLPLHSPHDGLLNTGSVVSAALVTGAFSGLVWKAMPSGQARLIRFILVELVTFGIVVGAAFAAETQIDRAISFVLPLVAITIGIQTIGIPLLAKADRLVRWQLVIPALVIALTIGAVFAGVGDQESGRLELPPRSTNIGPGGYI
jgi:hypothetical protein